MSSRLSSLETLEIRKQLLVAEIEIHRSEIRRDFDAIRHELRNLRAQAKSAATIASVVQSTLNTFSSFREPQQSQQKSSWFSKLIAGARLSTALWRTYRSYKDD